MWDRTSGSGSAWGSSCSFTASSTPTSSRAFCPATALLDVALVIAVVVVVLSGLMESGAVLLSFGLYAEGYYFWGPLHATSAKVLLALLIVHGALNIGPVRRLTRHMCAKETE